MGLLSLFGGGGGGGFSFSGSSSASQDVSAGITNNAAFQVGGSGSQSQKADQTAPTSTSSAKPDASAGLGTPFPGGDNTILYIAIGAVALIAVVAVIKH